MFLSALQIYLLNDRTGHVDQKGVMFWDSDNGNGKC